MPSNLQYLILAVVEMCAARFLLHRASLYLLYRKECHGYPSHHEPVTDN